MKDIKSNEYERNKNETKYGEFMSTCFAWIPLAMQKDRAEELQNITKKHKK